MNKNHTQVQEHSQKNGTIAKTTKARTQVSHSNTLTLHRDTITITKTARQQSQKSEATTFTQQDIDSNQVSQKQVSANHLSEIRILYFDK